MTVIAAAIDKDGTVFIGADGVCASTNDNNVVPLASPKVRLNGGFLIGSTGSARVLQISQFIFKPPALKSGEDLLTFMVTKFAKALRKVMKEEGGETKDDEKDEAMNGQCLVAFGGRLFEIDSYYGVIESTRTYHAVGCADQVAMGAMHARRGSRAKSMVEAGLEAAAAFDINIRPPFTIESLPCKSEKSPKAGR